METDQPKPIEWTVETIEKWIQLNPSTWKSVLAFEHNVALSSERERHQAIVDGMDGVIGEANTEIQQLREQLATSEAATNECLRLLDASKEAAIAANRIL